MTKEFDIFIDHWHEIALIWAQIALVASVLIFLYFQVRLGGKKTNTKKYEYISKNEIKYYWLAALGLTLSFTFYLNSLMVRVHMTETMFVLSLKISVTLGLGFVIGYFINIYLNVYYPYYQEKKLHKLRFADRISPVSDRKMRLLTEEEEDVHLTKDMIEHETIRAFEYDVWMDDESGYKLIETYRGSLHLDICEKCKYRTAREYKEELEKEPTRDSGGVLNKYYKCSYCDHEQMKTSKIAPLSGR